MSELGPEHLVEREKRWGSGTEPLTDFERKLQKRLLGRSTDFPPEFAAYLKNRIEIDPPRILASDIEKLNEGPRCRVYRTSNQQFNNGAADFIVFDGERYDPWAMHDNSTNPSRVTIVQPGLYLVTGHIWWDAAAAAQRQIAIVVNGATIIAASDDFPSTSIAQSIATVWAFQKDEYVQLRCYQASGVNLNVLTSSAFSPEMTVTSIADFPR